MVCTVVIVGLAGCVSSNVVPCGDGRVCPAGRQCVVLPSYGNEALCVDPAVVAACVDHQEFDACGPDLACFDGVCLAAGCGNGKLEPTEVCEDGNRNLGDGCSAECNSNETCRNNVVDLVNGEACDDGNAVDHDGCSSTCGLEQPAWIDLGAAPRHASGAAMAFDARRDVVVLFGGDDQIYPGHVFDDTWEWDGIRWEERRVIGPSPRSDAAMAFDGARDRTVLFGGLASDNNNMLGDTWQWDGSAWTRLAVSGPSPRQSHQMVYDAARRRIVLFGGVDRTNIPFSDTWTFDGTSWSKLPVDLPSTLDTPALGYDWKRGVVVLFGYSGTFPNFVPELWELVNTTWTSKSTTGPGPRASANFVWNSLTQRLQLTGGVDENFGPVTTAWEWNGSGWAQVADAPSTRLNTVGRLGSLFSLGNQESYAWNGANWKQVAPEERPDPRYDTVAVVDPIQRRIVLFGGRTGSSRFGDAWQYSGAWTKLPAGPAPRASTAMVYDAARNNIVLFGGWDNALNYLPGTWILDATGWQSPTLTMEPSARRGVQMAFDSARGNTVLFGGEDATNPLDDTWLWSGSAWRPVSPATKPPARSFAGIVYDPVRGRVVMFGGFDPSSASLDDTWEWDGTTWTEVQPAVRPPRRPCKLAWDATRKRVVLAGGGNGSAIDDVWEYDGVTWTPIFVSQSIPAHGNQLVVGDPHGAGVLAFGGFDNFGGLTNGLRRLRYEAATGSELCTGSDLDGDQLIGCNDPDCWSICTPQCWPGAASCPIDGPRCGDGVCSAPRETCRTCATDCACALTCGDLTCNNSETLATCVGDCTP